MRCYSNSKWICLGQQSKGSMVSKWAVGSFSLSLSTSHTLKLYFLQITNAFVQIVKISFFFKLTNVFVQNLNASAWVPLLRHLFPSNGRSSPFPASPNFELYLNEFQNVFINILKCTGCIKKMSDSDFNLKSVPGVGVYFFRGVLDSEFRAWSI